MGINNPSFPHLDDTPFPFLGEADPYEYHNSFEYDRWDDNKVELHLCNVLWNSDYKNVVKFDDDIARDAWFDSIESYTIELKSAFNVAPDGSIKLPIPMPVASLYNYFYIDLPIMTSEDNPIAYESTRRVTRYYYFIDSVMQLAPSTTLIFVTLDNWTTFINNVDIPHLMLERGHAPMAHSDVDIYLANPLHNNEFLLAPDFDFGNNVDIVKNSTFVPVNNGEKYIMFATSMSYTQVRNMQYPSALSGSSTPATFANADGRNGYQYIVNDYEWNYGSYDYNGIFTQSTPMQSLGDSIPNNTTVIAVKGSDAADMFAYMQEHVPFVFKTIRACFMVDDTMFTKGESFTFCNKTCYQVIPVVDSLLQNLTLNKSDFKYDAKYAKITKLYTFPYAQIEVTDNNGNVKTFRIENVSSVTVRKAVSLAFPYINMQAYLTGINGEGNTTYKWDKINGTSIDKRMWTDDFGNFIWSWDIPTYALYVRGYDSYKADNFPSQFTDRYNAIADYHKTVAMDNCQRENSVDAADNTQEMTNNSADTEQTNAVNLANTNKSNVNDSMQLLVDNMQLEYDKAEYVQLQQQTHMDDAVAYSNRTNNSNASRDNAITNGLTNADNAFQQANGVANAANIAGNGLAAALRGGPGEGLASTAGGMIATAVSTQAAILKNTASAGIITEGNTAKANIANSNNLDQNDVQKDLLALSTGANIDTMHDEAINTQNTNNGNASRTRNTLVGNAGNTYNTAIENAELQRNVSVNNSTYTRNTAVNNAQILLEQKRISAQQQYRSHALDAPIMNGQTIGDATLDAYERRGLQIKIRTETDSAIAQAGDLMLRYGYAFNQLWDMHENKLCFMKHFTYWKASDIWINSGEGVNQDAQRDIQSAFENGVTVWSDPTKIGKVEIYDNWK